MGVEHQEEVINYILLIAHDGLLAYKLSSRKVYVWNPCRRIFGHQNLLSSPIHGLTRNSRAL